MQHAVAVEKGRGRAAVAAETVEVARVDLSDDVTGIVDGIGDRGPAAGGLEISNHSVFPKDGVIVNL